MKSEHYLAGLWQETIEEDTLWRVDKLTPTCTRPNEYIGPSWSWISVSSSVKYWARHELRNSIYGEFNHLFPGRIDLGDQNSLEYECKVEQVGRNPFGEIKSGSLLATGIVIRGTLQYTSSIKGEPGQNKRYEHDPLKYELRLCHWILGELSFPFYADYILSSQYNPGYVPDQESLHLLEVLANTFLVLRQIDEINTFKRIGILKLSAAFIAEYNVRFTYEMFGVKTLELCPEMTVTII